MGCIAHASLLERDKLCSKDGPSGSTMHSGYRKPENSRKWNSKMQYRRRKLGKPQRIQGRTLASVNNEVLARRIRLKLSQPGTKAVTNRSKATLSTSNDLGISSLEPLNLRRWGLHQYFIAVPVTHHVSEIGRGSTKSIKVSFELINPNPKID